MFVGHRVGLHLAPVYSYPQLSMTDCCSIYTVRNCKFSHDVSHVSMSDTRGD